MRKLNLVVAVLTIALVLPLLSCGKKEEAAKQPGAATKTATSLTIGVSLLTRTHPFYQDLEAGLQEAADAAGYELLITAGEFDVAKQKDQIQDFIVRKVNAIIVSPCDSKSIGTAIKAANDAGIPGLHRRYRLSGRGRQSDLPCRLRQCRRRTAGGAGSAQAIAWQRQSGDHRSSRGRVGDSAGQGFRGRNRQDRRTSRLSPNSPDTASRTRPSAPLKISSRRIPILTPSSASTMTRRSARWRRSRKRAKPVG